MARLAWPSFGGGSNVSQSPIQDQQETWNYYTEPRDVPGGKSDLALYPSPGVLSRASAVETPGRTFFEQNGRAFTIIGATFYEVTETGTAALTLTNRGTVAVDANPATICGNGDGGGQLFITSGDVGYCYVLATNTLTTVRASGNTMGAMLDGYFLVLDSATSTFYVSDLFDGTTWDPTQFAQRSTAPDRWVAMLVPTNAREVWLLGEKTTEVWNNAGTFPFPFAPVPNALFTHGCAAPFSAADVGGALLWVSKKVNGQGDVVMAAGGAPQIVSSFAAAWALHTYGTISDAIGGSYSAAGHTFYLLTLPTEDITWALDMTTQTVAKRGTWVVASNAYQAWRPRFHAFAWGRHLAVDGVNGTVYEVSETYSLDVDGLPIRRVRRPPSLFSSHETLAIACIELLMETGLSSVPGATSTPSVVMRLSRDGGKTWSAERSRSRSVGSIGEYRTRVRWWRCGAGEDIASEFVVTDAVPYRLLGVTVTIRDRGGA